MQKKMKKYIYIQYICVYTRYACCEAEIKSTFYLKGLKKLESPRLKQEAEIEPTSFSPNFVASPGFLVAGIYRGAFLHFSENSGQFLENRCFVKDAPEQFKSRYV